MEISRRIRGERRCGWMVSAVVTAALSICPAYGQSDALFIDSNGNIGVGTNIPTVPMEVRRGDGSARVLVSNAAAPSVALRPMFELVNNGSPFFLFRDTSRSLSYSFATLGQRFIISNQQVAGVQFDLAPNGNLTLSGELFTNGGMSMASSREKKTELETVEASEILQKVVELPISTWTYKHDGVVRHIGPMAEDFAKAFDVGRDDKTISTIDTNGVALAAIQGLKQSQDREISILRKENLSLKRDIQELRALIGNLTIMQQDYVRPVSY